MEGVLVILISSMISVIIPNVLRMSLSIVSFLQLNLEILLI